MKKLLLITVALMASILSLSAQIVKGDMNGDGQLTVADLSNTASRILESAPLEYISTVGNPYQADNGAIVGTWYSSDGQTVTFNSDGTQDLLPGYQYKYQPALGRILFTDAHGKIRVHLVYDFDGEKLVLEGDKETLYLYNTKPGTNNGHEYVDLGLPSGIKWATCNVGAEKPEEYGDYFAWGETEPQTSNRYYWDSYKWCKGSNTTMTKYCTSSSYGTVDNKTVLDPEDDAAHVNWGGSWRMPTKEEQDELLTKCTWAWTTRNGVYGRKVTGPNGNSIFLPAAGCRDLRSLSYAGSIGYYWSSSLVTSNSGYAYYLYFNSSYVGLNYFNSSYVDFNYRYYGRSVRPVCQ